MNLFVHCVATEQGARGRIVQIGAYVDGPTPQTFEIKANHNGSSLSEFFVTYHGLTDSILARCPPLDEATLQFCDWAQRVSPSFFIYVGDGLATLSLWFQQIRPETRQRVMDTFPKGWMSGKTLLKRLVPGRSSYTFTPLFTSIMNYEPVGLFDARVRSEKMSELLHAKFPHFPEYTHPMGWCAFLAHEHSVQARRKLYEEDAVGRLVDVVANHAE